MGLLQKLKSALGLNGTGSSESGRSGDVDVTVEREPSTEDEDAVKGTETASSEGAAEPGDSAADSDDAEDEAPAADEFETLADEDETAEEAAADAEAADAEETGEAETEGVDETEETDAEETDDADAEAVDEAEETTDTETVEGSTDPVTELNGIGPAYGDRLAGAGIETVGELAAADAAELADQIELGESRVAGWIEQATEY
ncbi:helix-hairpin-helix domain-containing protein [Haloarcula salinisoli]|uniref:Helix-hairpin-helix domain-containing protein n=1 Tax=Haloarcula salinisoli TaxID=2487746 RepID=A0A8J8CA47_9EURY|nr:helix-hairpin-helix domain-containing protein [Halomicroarcula salinisoli]MBX0302623.1 hypothetical protein [Halomicroarcula salinisoli]